MLDFSPDDDPKSRKILDSDILKGAPEVSGIKINDAVLQLLNNGNPLF